MVVKIQDYQKKRKKDKEKEFEALNGLYVKAIFTKKIEMENMVQKYMNQFQSLQQMSQAR